MPVNGQLTRSLCKFQILLLHKKNCISYFAVFKSKITHAIQNLYRQNNSLTLFLFLSTFFCFVLNEICARTQSPIHFKNIILSFRRVYSIQRISSYFEEVLVIRIFLDDRALASLCQVHHKKYSVHFKLRLHFNHRIGQTILLRVLHVDWSWKSF